MNTSLPHHRKSFISAVLALACACSGFAFAKDGTETGFPREATIDDSKLVLNGTAIRTVWGFGVYEIGLFLNERSSDEDFIIGTDRGPKRVRIAMLREVSQEQFTSTVQESIDQNFSDEEKKKFAGELSAFLGAFHGGSDLRKGSVVTIDYLPGKGMLMAMDDNSLGSIPGDDFYHAILRLWLVKPLQPSIKDGLLGRNNGRG